MLDNNLYNLMLQMVQENKSLWRIKNEYKKDAKTCKTCKAFWDKLEASKEKHINELEALIKKHMA